MFEFADLILIKYRKQRIAWSLSFFFFGTPLIYFFRDGLGLAQSSKVFTAVFVFGSLFFAIPFKKLTTLYTYNLKLLYYIIGYWVIALFYLAVYTPNRGWFTNTTSELVYAAVIFLAGLIFATSSLDELLEYVLPASFWICLLGSLGMIFIVIKNPNFALGMRASISFSEDGSLTWGNPHIYGRSAYAGLIASVLSMPAFKGNTRKMMLLYFGVMVNFAVIGLTQSFQTFIALALFLAIYSYFQTTPTTTYRLLKWIFSWRGLLVLLFILWSIWYILYRTQLVGTLTNVFNIIGGRFDKIFNLLSLQSAGPDMIVNKALPKQVDVSAMGRVENIQSVWDGFIENVTNGEWWWILIGHGYQKLYVDCPLIQTLNDLGLLGFLAYFLLHVGILQRSFREYRFKTHDGILFFCYFIPHTFVQDLVFGMPYDFLRWSLFLFMARILKPYVVAKPAAL